MSTKTTGGVAVGLNALLGQPKPRKKRKAKRWEQTYYNSYGNYTHYRFQDFRAGCEHRRDGGMYTGDCDHPDNELGDDAECLCDFCPLVEKAYSDDPEDENYDGCDYSEGEQPIFVLPPNAQVQPASGPEKSNG